MGHERVHTHSINAVIVSLLNELHSGPGFGGMLDRTQYELSSFSNGKVNSRTKKTSKGTKHKTSAKGHSFRPDLEGNQERYTVTVTQDQKDSDGEARSIGHGSEDMIITRNVEWTVTSIERDRASTTGTAVASSYCIDR